MQLKRCIRISQHYNSTHYLYSSLSYQQITLHSKSILVNIWDSLYYMREVAIHTMDYIDAATTGILSPHVLPVKDLRKMLSHTAKTLPSTKHLPISSEDAPHFYRHLCTHILIADKQFSLLINVQILDHTQLMEIYEVFNLDIPHKNFSACYIIQNKYFGIIYDATSAVEISEDEFKTCQEPNGQFHIFAMVQSPVTYSVHIRHTN